MEWVNDNWELIALVVTIVWGIASTLWGIYEKTGKLTAQDVIGTIVNEIQEHSKKTGDRKLKRAIKEKNDNNVNYHVKIAKTK